MLDHLGILIRRILYPDEAFEGRQDRGRQVHDMDNDAQRILFLCMCLDIRREVPYCKGRHELAEHSRSRPMGYDGFEHYRCQGHKTNRSDTYINSRGSSACDGIGTRSPFPR